MADRIGKEKKRQLSEQQREKISSEIFKLIDEHSAAPMWGLAGVPLVNVLELNLALRKRMTQLSEKLE